MTKIISSIKYYILATLFFCQFSMEAQEGGVPIYSDYLSDNLYIIHPSMAGAAVWQQLRLTARQQWFDQDQAPNLQALAFNARLGERNGVGAIIYSDQNGYHSINGGQLTYAYHLLLSRNEVDLNQLSFGLSAGVIESRLDQTQFDEIFDPLLSELILNDNYFNVDLGFSYNYLDFSSHFSIKNLVLENISSDPDAVKPLSQRTYLLTFLHTFGDVFSPWKFEPSVLFQMVERTREKTMDFNFKTYYIVEDEGKIWAGLSYRRSFDGTAILNEKLQFFTPFIGGTYKNFMLAYSYSQQSGSIRFSNGAIHQLTLGINFGGRGEPYNCNCSAVNF